MTRGKPQAAPRELRFNHYTALKIGMPVLLALLAISAGVALSFASEVRVVGKGVNGAERELTRVLRELNGTWDEAERARLLAEAAARAPRLAGPLHRRLRAGNDPLLGAALEYAGAMGESELRSPAAQLAFSGPPRFRGTAVLAAEALGPWPASDVQELLLDELIPVQVAALRLSSERFDELWAGVFVKLGSEFPQVRQAALAAIPEELPSEARGALWRMIEHAEGDEASHALRALARTVHAVDFEPDVLDLLLLAETPTQLSALDLLANLGAPLSDAQPVWNLARDVTADLAVRCRALQCLERTGSYVVADLRGWIGQAEPSLQYFAARCLLDAGEPEGFGVLRELLVAENPAVAQASRRLLSRMTGATANAPEEVAEMLESRAWTQRALPPADLHL